MITGFVVSRYLLVLRSADVCGVGVGTGAGDVAQFSAELVLSVASQGPSPTAAAAAVLGNLQRRFLFLVLLAFKMLLIGLNVWREPRPLEKVFL